MSPFRRRVAATGVAALALAIGGVGSATSATAAQEAPPSYAPSWLAIDTKNSEVRFADGNGLLAPTQSLRTEKACALATDGSLIDFTGAPVLRRVVPSVGYQNGGFGVRESATASGTSCSAVDAPTETLTLTLDNLGVDGLIAASASLDVDLKGSVRILATATLSTDANQPPAYFELQSGNLIGSWPSEPTATVFTCTDASDSGPDSTTNNNCRWEISAPSWTSIPEDGVAFDTLKLEAKNGSFSLMGGAEGFVDGSPTSPFPSYFGATGPSVFELVEGLIDCGETVTLDPTELDSTWFRLPNFADTSAAASVSAQTTSSCKPFPYSSRTAVDADGVYAEFTKPLDFETSSQALWTTTFLVGGKPSDVPPDITVTLDYLDDNRVKQTLVIKPLPPCDSSYGTRDDWVGPDSEPDGPTACLVEAVRGSGKLKDYVTYTAYIYGDAGMRR